MPTVIFPPIRVNGSGNTEILRAGVVQIEFQTTNTILRPNNAQTMQVSTSNITMERTTLWNQPDAAVRLNTVPPTSTLAAAGNQINVAGSPCSCFLLDNTSGGALILTSTPTITASGEGHFLVMTNISANLITIQDNALLAGSNVFNGGVNIALAQWESCSLMFTQTRWIAIDIK